MKELKLLWKFSRPHTLVGSFVSVTSVLFIALNGQSPDQEILVCYFFSLIAALACNIYITGLNQWSDIDVDKINKPWLPIASGKLSLASALRIVMVSGLLALVVAACLSGFFFMLISAIAMLGTAYSLPPLKLKRNHFLAAAAITVVRGLLVNIGFYIHYKLFLNQPVFPTVPILLLTLFVVFFSIGIAWFKDIPDTEGDREFSFSTLALLIGRKATLQAGVASVCIAYVIIIVAAWKQILPHPLFYIGVHALFLVSFLIAVKNLNLKEARSIKNFYLFFWMLFFLEYVFFPLGLYL